MTTGKRKSTLEILLRDSALSAATEGLTIEELQALTPALLRAAIPLRDALQIARNEIERLTMVTGYNGEAHYPRLAQIDNALSLAKEGEE